MTSTTANKKQIVDFLWDWAENADWAKLLIQKIVNTESSLQTNEREEVFKYFLESINLEKDLPKISIKKPNYLPQSKQIELISLSEVTGVNKLAKDQTINFSPNLTVIYGENGTGKTGYGRILKSLGFSYDQNETIIGNIFREHESQSAKIDYKADDEKTTTFPWNGKDKNDDLVNISVFNNNCVQISLVDNRHLIVSPIGFHLFDLVSSELGKLNELLKAKKGEYPTEIDWIENLNDGTLQHQFISKLTKDSSNEKLDELSNFGEEQESELKNNETQLSKLNKDLLENEMRGLKFQIDEICNIIDKIDQVKITFNADTWEKQINTNKDISELEKRTKKGIAGIAESKGIEFYESDEFKNFISAAESYIKKINKTEYPQEDDICVYCRQPLEKDAMELVANYRRLLNDKTEENIVKLKKEKQSLINQVSRIDTPFKLNFASFGLDEEDKPVQPPEFISFSKRASILKNTFIKDEITNDSVFDLKYEEFQQFITDKKEQLEEQLTKKTELFESIDVKEKELKKLIAELKDRKLLFSKKEAVKRIIDNKKIISILDKQTNAFSTNSISRKTSQARDELISQNFTDIFHKELKALRKSDLPIDLSFGTDRGITKLKHQISKHQLLEILSEGEQKAIALAEFLTELQLDNIKAPVIFDDPVNSLDHKIIDAFSKRLIRLSEQRQVVIFTHSVLLFNSLLYLSKQQNFKCLKYNFYNSRKDYDFVGLISEAEEEKNKVKENISNINNLLNNKTKDRREVDVAKEGFGELRSAIELFIEHEVFNGTVQRYQKHISLGKFIQINSDLIAKHKENLSDIYERCCGFINAHSNPEQVYNDPTIEDLKSDFNDFQTIRSEFPVK